MSPPGPISLHISGVLLLLSLRCLGTSCLPAHVLCLAPRVFLEKAQLSRVRCCHEPSCSTTGMWVVVCLS